MKKTIKNYCSVNSHAVYKKGAPKYFQFLLSIFYFVRLVFLFSVKLSLIFSDHQSHSSVSIQDQNGSPLQPVTVCLNALRDCVPPVWLSAKT